MSTVTVTARCPVTKFRELYIAPNEQGFLRCFGHALVARGFRIRQERKGRFMVWTPDPAIDYQRGEEWLECRQEVPDRLALKDQRLSAALYRVQIGAPSCLEELAGLLLSEGDDRAEVVAGMEEATAAGQDGAPADMTVDSGSRSGAPGVLTEADARIVPGTVLAEARLRERVLTLFGIGAGSKEPL